LVAGLMVSPNPLGTRVQHRIRGRLIAGSEAVRMQAVISRTNRFVAL